MSTKSRKTENRGTAAYSLLLMTLTTGMAAALLTGCGGQAYRSAGTTTGSSSSPKTGSQGSPAIDPAAPQSPSSSGGSSGDVADPGAAALPPITTDFTVNGAAGTNPKFSYTGVNTDTILKVRVTGGEPMLVDGTGFTAVYRCFKVKVKALGQTQTAFVTNTGSDGSGYCAGAKSSVTLDFSSRLSASGNSNVTIEVTADTYDNCRLYSFYIPGDGIYYAGCPLSTVYKTHRVQGTLEIQTNGTSLP